MNVLRAYRGELMTLELVLPFACDLVRVRISVGTKVRGGVRVRDKIRVRIRVRVSGQSGSLDEG